MGLKSPHRSWLEQVVLLIIFIGLFVIVLQNYLVEKKVCTQQRLCYELADMRQGLRLYSLMNKRMPETLVELATAKYQFPGEATQRRFIEHVSVNDNLQIVDPYGNEFKYDKDKGWIWSATPGYQSW
jgi:hypothetical protein